MKINLHSRKWKEFSIKEIFNTQKSARGFQAPTGANVTNKNLTSGKEPRITVTSLNNGVLGFCSSSDNSYRTFENFISVSFLGSAFYHRYKASLDMKVHCLKVSNYELSINSSSFLITSIKKNIENASYGNQVSSTDLPHKRILLPIKDNKKPDYQFMEDYSRNLLEAKKEKYLNYNKKKLADLEYKEIEPLENKEWKEFFIEDLFDITIGKNIDGNKINKTSGYNPYITRKETNNGLDGFINYDNFYKNMYYPVITIGNETAYPFVQSFSFFTGTKVNIMKPKIDCSNRILFFISESIKQQRKKYSYSYTINST